MLGRKMATISQRYNLKSPAVKRLMKEATEMREPTEDYYAQPLDENLFEWHFTVRGPADTCFADGLYHGKIILPTEYPMKPPSIILLTPNGRFHVNQKICLSISGHHPESWQPSWSIRTALLAIIAFMPTKSGGALGSLDYTELERTVLAKKSVSWKCPVCGSVCEFLKPRKLVAEKEARTEEQKHEQELAKQICFTKEQNSNINPLSDGLSATSSQPSSSFQQTENISESFIAPADLTAEEQMDNHEQTSRLQDISVQGRANSSSSNVTEGYNSRTDPEFQTICRTFTNWMIGVIAVLLAALITRRIMAMEN